MPAVRSASGTYTISAQVRYRSTVGLSSAANVVGHRQIRCGGKPSGGIDGGGYALATDLLGTSFNWGGATFTLGAAGALQRGRVATRSACRQGTYIDREAAGHRRQRQPDQPGVRRHVHGRHARPPSRQNISDWYRPQNYAGEVHRLDHGVPPHGERRAGSAALQPVRLLAGDQPGEERQEHRLAQGAQRGGAGHRPDAHGHAGRGHADVQSGAGHLWGRAAGHAWRTSRRVP